jgi:hypothetical protein
MGQAREGRDAAAQEARGVRLLGWMAGLALAIVIAALVPTLGVALAALLGFSLSMIGSLLGMAAERRA